MKTLTKAEYDALCNQHLSIHGGLGFGNLRHESLENILKVTLKEIAPEAYTLTDRDRESLLQWLRDGYQLDKWWSYRGSELAIYFDLPKVWEYHMQQIDAKAQAEAAATRLKAAAQELFEVEVLAAKTRTQQKVAEERDINPENPDEAF